METGKVFSPEMPFYRPSASPSYEASSHVKYYAYSCKLLSLILLDVCCIVMKYMY